MLKFLILSARYLNKIIYSIIVYSDNFDVESAADDFLCFFYSGWPVKIFQDRLGLVKCLCSLRGLSRNFLRTLGLNHDNTLQIYKICLPAT